MEMIFSETIESVVEIGVVFYEPVHMFTVK